MVAPHAGAWIETDDYLDYNWRLPSHPMRVRGLKQFNKRRIRISLFVAPHAGVWIETNKIMDWSLMVA